MTVCMYGCFFLAKTTELIWMTFATQTSYPDFPTGLKLMRVKVHKGKIIKRLFLYS